MADEKFYIGVDVGGTHVSAAVVNGQTGEIDGAIQDVPVNGSGKETLRYIYDGKQVDSTHINDASAFALGEYYAGAAKGSNRTLAVTLGTGFGSTFLINGEIQEKAGDDIPCDGYLYNIPFCLFNNLWGTNFTMWREGSISYRLKLE